MMPPTKFQLLLYKMSELYLLGSADHMIRAHMHFPSFGGVHTNATKEANKVTQITFGG